jgi:hypothetical protein
MSRGQAGDYQPLMFDLHVSNSEHRVFKLFASSRNRRVANCRLLRAVRIESRCSLNELGCGWLLQRAQPFQLGQTEMTLRTLSF